MRQWSLAQAQRVKSSPIRIRIRLLNPMSYTTTKLKTFPLMEIVRRSPHGIRLKGHIGAAGKLTATWGELKSSNE